MKIIGLYADEAIFLFSIDQCVNIWEVWSGNFYCEALMKNLPEEVRESPEDYFLEPTDAEGTPVNLQTAIKRCRECS